MRRIGESTVRWGNSEQVEQIQPNCFHLFTIMQYYFHGKIHYKYKRKKNKGVASMCKLRCNVVTEHSIKLGCGFVLLVLNCPIWQYGYSIT